MYVFRFFSTMSPLALVTVFFISPLVLTLRPSEDGADVDARLKADIDERLGRGIRDMDAFSAMQKATGAASSLKSQAMAVQSALNASTHKASPPDATRLNVDIEEKYLLWLFDLIDRKESDHQQNVGNGHIDKKEFDEHVKGPWKDPLWLQFMTTTGARDCSESRFVKEWDPAIDRAFEKLGGHQDGHIDMSEIQRFWQGNGHDVNQEDHKDPPTQEELDFAKDTFIQATNPEENATSGVASGDGKMDGAEFEQFIFNVMVMRAIKFKPAKEGTITWDELMDNDVAQEAFGGKAMKGKWEAFFGAARPDMGMNLKSLYRFLDYNRVFKPHLAL